MLCNSSGRAPARGWWRLRAPCARTSDPRERPRPGWAVGGIALATLQAMGLVVGAGSSAAAGSIELEILVDGEPGWVFPECEPAGGFEDLCTVLAVGPGWALYGQASSSADASGQGAGQGDDLDTGLSLGASFAFGVEDNVSRSVLMAVRLSGVSAVPALAEAVLSAAGGWTTGSGGGAITPASDLPFLAAVVDSSPLVQLSLAGPVVLSGYGSAALPLSGQSQSNELVPVLDESISLIFAFELVGPGWLSVSSVFAIAAASAGATDLDADGRVDGVDLGLLLGSWGQPGPADLDGSGVVDGGDLGVLLAAWTGSD